MPNTKDYILSQFGLGGLIAPEYQSTGKDLPAGGGVYKDEGKALSVGGALYQEQQLNAEGITLSTLPDGKVGTLGLPVFCDMQLELPDGSFMYFDNVLADVTMSKNIVKTPVNGMSGTIKEYIADGDFMIKIRGMLIAGNTVDYPKRQVAALTSILKRTEVVPVVSEYLKQFGIYFLCIEDYSFPQRNGFQHIQLFEFSASSDTLDDVLLERI